MNRRETTQFLSKLTEIRLYKTNDYWSKEVTFDFGTQNQIRIDYMQFVPENQLCVDGLEKGVFRGYEIKSCKDDFKSGHGLNYICEYNYIIMTMWTYKDLMDSGLLDSIPVYTGILIAVPDVKGRTNKDILLGEFEKPSLLPKEPDTKGWKLVPVKNSLKTYRKRSLTEMLFCLMRAK